MPDTGRGRPTAVRAGLRPVTMGRSSSRATGKATAAASNMTTAGIGTATATGGNTTATEIAIEIADEHGGRGSASPLQRHTAYAIGHGWSSWRAVGGRPVGAQYLCTL